MDWLVDNICGRFDEEGDRVAVVGCIDCGGCGCGCSGDGGFGRVRDSSMLDDVLFQHSLLGRV